MGCKAQQLIGDNEECTRSLATLILTGRAVRYIHNGKIVYDKDGELLVCKIIIMTYVMMLYYCI